MISATATYLPSRHSFISYKIEKNNVTSQKTNCIPSQELKPRKARWGERERKGARGGGKREREGGREGERSERGRREGERERGREGERERGGEREREREESGGVIQ